MAKIINGSSLYLALANYLASNAYLNDTAQDVLEMVCVWIDEAKAIQVPKWIPVTERLPEKEGSYLVITTTGAVTTARFYTEKTFPPTNYRQYSYQRNAAWSHNRNVIYWMPMPEPPKEE